MNLATPFFSVVTPTYNRAHTLGRVYRSLLAQTCRDFEWLVVDDGSTDGTSKLVRQWFQEGALRIRYLRQPNGGKHVAFNFAVREARGEMVVPLDSDDECVPRALERFQFHWASIPKHERDRFSGIMCLCMDERGLLLGGPLPEDTIDGHPFEVMDCLRRTAEMWAAFRTDVLRAYPFPEYQNERFVPEGLVWNRIGRRYITRFVNEGLRIYFDSPDSLSRSSVLIRMASPRATLAYYSEAMQLTVGFSLRLRAAINLWRFAMGSARFREALRGSTNCPGLSALGFLPGALLALRDRRGSSLDRAGAAQPPMHG